MEIWELLARAEIEDLVKRYAYYGDAGKSADLADLFVEDGVLESAHGVSVEGRAAIRGHLDGVAAAGRSADAPTGFVRHNVSNVLVAFEGPERAVVNSYQLIVTAQGVDSGRYRDTVVKTAEGWRFARRRSRLDRPADQGSAFLQAGHAALKGGDAP